MTTCHAKTYAPDCVCVCVCVYIYISIYIILYYIIFVCIYGGTAVEYMQTVMKTAVAAAAVTAESDGRKEEGTDPIQKVSRKFSGALGKIVGSSPSCRQLIACDISVGRLIYSESNKSCFFFFFF